MHQQLKEVMRPSVKIVGPDDTILEAARRLREVMTDGICWAYDDDPVEKAVEIMSDRQIRRLPIVDRQKRLVGIASLGDLAVERSEMKPAAEALSAISKP